MYHFQSGLAREFPVIYEYAVVRNAELFRSGWLFSMHSLGFRFVVGLLGLACTPVFGQRDTSWIKPLTSGYKDFAVQTLEEKVSITSQTPLLLKEAPGTVSVITAHDIQANGARDLIDVLRLVPGFEFNVDVQGVVGIGSRGNSANEAILVLVDGLEMNDLLYGSNQFGTHFPLDQIRKIEIIRGPGSVIYGGLAVYAVINILTYASEIQNGLNVANTIGETDRGMARMNLSTSFGQKLGDFSYALTASASEANRSDRNYKDLEGNQYDMLRNSSIRNRYLGIGIRFKKWRFQGAGDVYELSQRDNQTLISSKVYPIQFQHVQGLLKYMLIEKEAFTLSPFFQIRHQDPWLTDAEIDSVDQDKITNYHVDVYRTTGGLSGNWKPRPNLDISGAVQWSHDQTQVEFSPYDQEKSSRYDCLSTFAQGFWKTPYLNLTLGIRYDNHSFFSPFFSPRVAISREFGKVYVKASANQSYRTPALANISLSLDGQIEAQRTHYLEAEIGYNPNAQTSFSLNGYRISARNGIVFQVLDDGLTEGYSNQAKMGTQGIEAEAKCNFRKMSIKGSYSFYTTAGMNTYEGFHVAGKNLNLAYPAHKLILRIRTDLHKVQLRNNFLFLSDRFGYNGDDENPGFLNYGSVFQWNIHCFLNDFLLKGFRVGIGINDLTNSRYSYIQSYNSGHMPLPAMSREYVLKFQYGIHINKE